MQDSPKPTTPTPPEPKPPPEPLPPNPPPIPPRAERATWALAILTGIVAIFTAALAVAAFWTMLEERHASKEQLGVRTWLYLDPAFDSKELKLARKELARQLNPYDPAKREEVNDDALNFFESVGTLYKRSLLDDELATTSFSYWATRYWQAAKVYVADERRAKHDQDLYADFEEFAKAMQKGEQPLSDADLKEFLAEEEALETQ
jgi:hypothetical protein